MLLLLFPRPLMQVKEFRSRTRRVRIFLSRLSSEGSFVIKCTESITTPGAVFPALPRYGSFFWKGSTIDYCYHWLITQCNGFLMKFLTCSMFLVFHVVHPIPMVLLFLYLKTFLIETITCRRMSEGDRQPMQIEFTIGSLLWLVAPHRIRT